MFSSLYSTAQKYNLKCYKKMRRQDMSITKFVANNIPHNNQTIQPENRDAITLWEYTKNIEPAFNCRLHSIL